MFGATGERIHPQWKAEGRQRRGDIHGSHYACLRERCGLRLPKLEIDGAEEGRQEC